MAVAVVVVFDVAIGGLVVVAAVVVAGSSVSVEATVVVVVVELDGCNKSCTTLFGPGLMALAAGAEELPLVFLTVSADQERNEEEENWLLD